MAQTKISAWLSAARLRTLPLSISGIITGTALAYAKGHFDWKIFVIAVITTILFQVLSNFANDYGDGVKGTDNEDRVGPQRAVQSGIISKVAMKQGVVLTAILSLLSALSLIYLSFGLEYIWYVLAFTVLAMVAIVAAIKYTVGDSAYGYNGLGDVFVFLFFGLVAVGGSYFLFTKQLELLVLFPAIAIGLLSVAVLNLNNMRDELSDRASKKNTVVVKFGGDWAKKYHFVIVILAIICISYYCFLTFDYWISWLPIFIAIPLSIHLIKVYKTQENKDLDPELKKVALSTFLMSILILLSALLT